MSKLKCEIIPVLEDNYAYLVYDSKSREAVVVDPSEAEPIRRAINENKITLRFIFNTHHHWDHVGGNIELKEEFGCQLLTAKSNLSRVEGADRAYDESGTFTFLHNSIEVIETPGHTSGGVCLWFRESGLLFTGDTLFSLGCGRLFEGTASQMWNSLQKLSVLPEDTLVYGGHEYTVKNCEFAKSLEPSRYADLLAELKAKRAAGNVTVPSTLGFEKKLNPFLRCEDPEFKKLVGFREDAPSEEVFAHVRKLKDRF